MTPLDVMWVGPVVAAAGQRLGEATTL